MTEADFLRLILEQPDDDLTRLAFADWLLERGDEAAAARGEFIQAQVHLAQHAEGVGGASRWVDTDRVPHWQAREKALLAAHEPQWAKAIVPLVCDYQFHRGFIEHVTLAGAQFPGNAAKLFALTPLRRIRLPGGLTARQRASPSLLKLSGLDFSRCGIGDQGLNRLLDSPQLANITWLDLSECHLTAHGISRLAVSPLLGRLRHLNLGSNYLNLEAIQALFQSPHWGSLNSLVLTGNLIDARAQQFLTQSLRGSSSPSLLRSMLQLVSRQQREYTNADVRDLARRAGRNPEEAVRTLAEGLGDGHRKVRSAAASMLATLGGKATAAVPDLVRRLFDRNPHVRDHVAPALARLVSELPRPKQRWMCVLANPLLPPAHNLWSALEHDDLPTAVLNGYAEVVARRMAWYGHTLAGKEGPAPAGPSAPEGRPAVLTATNQLLAQAGRHAARHGGGPKEAESGRHREAAWLLARLTALLLG
jgi:uncharacterized protein (TIGR02996 family)